MCRCSSYFNSNTREPCCGSDKFYLATNIITSLTVTKCVNSTLEMFHFKDREIKSKINRKEENKSNRAGRQAENKIDTSLIGGIWRGIVYGI
jgi:hypothetical protein